MDCIKTKFADEKTALSYLKKLKDSSFKEKKPIRTYLCQKCMSWHLTSIENKESMKVKYLQREITNLKLKLTLCQQSQLPQ